MTIEIKVDDKNVVSLLKNLSEKVEDMTPAMRIVAGIMHDAVEENFEKEGRPKWTPLAQATIKQREKKGWAGQTPYRLDTIFRTNVQQAFQAGHYQQLMRTVEARPYWQYVVVMDGRTRQCTLS